MYAARAAAARIIFDFLSAMRKVRVFSEALKIHGSFFVLRVVSHSALKKSLLLLIVREEIAQSVRRLTQVDADVVWSPEEDEV